jgi:anti-anti-sigma factor
LISGPDADLRTSTRIETGAAMDISKRKEKNAVVVSVKGRLDAVSSAELEKELTALMAEGEADFVIDFGELDYISSAGIRSILVVAKKLKAKEGYLSICALKDLVKEVFEISGFNSIIPIFESVESALDQI